MLFSYINAAINIIYYVNVHNYSMFILMVTLISTQAHLTVIKFAICNNTVLVANIKPTITIAALPFGYCHVHTYNHVIIAR